MYRCNVSNDGGSVVSNIAIVDVYASCGTTTHGTTTNRTTSCEVATCVIMVRFTQDTYNGSEESLSVMVTLELVGGTVFSPFNVTVTPSERSPVSAKGRIDFSTPTLIATFTRGATMKNVSIPVTPDNILERLEEFDLILTVPSSLGPGITAGDRNMATGIISDSTKLTVRFQSTHYTGTEDEGFILVILELIGGRSDYPFNVTVTPSEQSPVSAENGIDFNTTTLTATFAIWMTMSNVSIPIMMDNIVEEREEFDLTLNVSPSIASAITAGSRDSAVGVIIDTTILRVEFASGQFVGSESSGFIEVIVIVAGGSSITPITVTVTPSVQSPVSAMGSGADFSSNPFNITINAGATDGRANLSVTCDNITEGLETFDMTLTIASDSPEAILGRDTSEGQINDSTVVVSFDQSSYGVMEDDGSVNLMLLLSQSSSVQFQVMISTIDATTVAGQDYNGNQITVNVQAGVEIQPFTVNIIDNNIVECNEKFNVTMTSVTTCGVTIGSNRISEVMIRDDDRATVSLNQSQYSVLERDNSLAGTITLSSRASEDVIVEVTISDGSANAGVDYATSTALVFNVTISAGSTSSSFSIDIINDMIQEDNETFNIAIRLLPSCLSLSLGTSSSTVTIIDNDVAMITFTSSIFSGLESSGVISATITISGGIVSSKDIDIPITFIEGIASAADFDTVIQTVTIFAGLTSSTVNIPVINDNIVEGNETFSMSLSVPSSLGPKVTTGTITSAIVAIIDTSRIKVRFTSSRYTGKEDEGFVVVTLELNRGISAYPFNVTITPSERSPVSAEGGVDFNIATLTATFASGMNISTVSIALINDSIAEEHEEFSLTLNVPSSLGPAITAGDRDNATGVITDSTVLGVEFASRQFIGSESSGFIEVIVIVTGGSSITPITVTVTPSVQSPVSAIGSGVDFNSNPFNITINAGATDGRANVSVTCDDEVERLETFDMTLTITNDSPGIILGSRDICEGQINDSTVEINFSQLSYEVMESNGSVTIMILLSQASLVQFEVEVSTMDVTATGSVDYNELDRRITIFPRVISQSLLKIIIDDNIVECNEAFNVTMTSVTTCGVTIGRNRSSEVIIRDNDGAIVSLSQSQYSVAESDSPLAGTITLSSRTSKDVIVEVIISNESANAGVDYAMSTALVFNVTISAGATSSSFSIDIINDMIQEDNETFNITIRLLPSCLSLSLGISSSTVMIIDNDVAMIAFTSSTFSGLESSGVISATIAISGGIFSSKDIDIPITFTEGNASATDFDTAMQTVTIIAGVNSSTVNIPVINDNIVEGDESFSMSLSVPSSLGPEVTTGTIISATGTINDTTRIRVRFISNRYSGTEDEGFVLVTLELRGGTSAYPFNVTVTPSEQSPVSAEGGLDFNTAPLTATFASGITMSNVNVPVIMDSIGGEKNEVLGLTLDMSPSLAPAITAGNRDRAVGVIVDITILRVEFPSPQFIGSESSGFIEVTVRITGGFSKTPITVTVTPSVQSPVSAMGSGVDFNSNPFTITMNAGATNGRANVSVTCDNITEGLETFDMTLTITSDSSGLMLGRDLCEGHINDTTVTLSFSQLSYEVMESNRSVTIMILLSRASLVQFDVEISTMDVTATGSIDYDEFVITITIPPGVTSQSLTTNIIDNNITECDEKFMITMTSVTTCGVTIGSNRISEVIISDDDGATVSLSQSRHSVEESDNSLTGTITLSNRTSEDVILEVTISDGSANAGVDYAMSTALVFNVTISAGSTSSSFSIDIINDMIQEDNETFNITIRLLPSCLSLSLGTSSSTVTIIDNDVAMITFTSSTFSGLESSGVILATIAISGGIVSSKGINIPIIFMEGNASAVDFDIAMQTIAIVAGTNSSTVNIPVINDNIVEEDETFSMSLSVPSSLSPEVTTGTITSAIVTITDTTTIRVRFVSNRYSGSEAEGFVVVTLELNRGISAYPFNVTITPSQQSLVSAEGGDDFNTTTLTAIFASGKTTSNVSVPIMMDNIAEEREEFDLTLNVLPSLAPAITAGSRDSAVGVIVDSTILRVEFASPQFVGSESSGFIEVIVRITGGFSVTPITVTVTPSVQLPVSAMGSGVDFNSNPFTIRINAGATDGRANVSMTCDNVTEGLETFDMRLTIASGSPGVILGRNTSEGQINDSTVVVNFGHSSYEVMETNKTVNVMLLLSEVSPTQFEVDIGTMDLTATANLDYVGAVHTVTIPSGVLMQTFAINITDNSDVECNETFSMAIISVTTCGVTIGSDRVSEVMIRDDDRATVSLSQSQYSVAESDNSLTGAITLNMRTSEDVIVEVTISDGSANAGVDYAMSTALVFNYTISAGLNSSSFSIDIINDMIQEDNETFNITIRLLPSCLSLSLGTSSSTVMIIDDDVALITFTSSTFSGLESSGVISATIAISGGIVSSKNINIPITFIERNSSASDFNSTIQTVTIVAGTNSSEVNIQVINDSIVEGDETFRMILSVPSSLGPEIATGIITSATVTIIDTSTVRVVFEQNQFRGSEVTGFVIINLKLDGGISSYPFNVTVIPSELSPVSAEGGVDFNTATLIATFASGMDISTVSIALINDSIAEEHEEFGLTLNVPSSLGPAITVGNRDSATGVITDSTMLQVELTLPQFIGSESSGFIEVIVRITGGSSITPITVTVTPSVQSPVSAMGSGIDFNSDPFTITINAGATVGRANVSVTCDNVTEGLETFNMTLTITSGSTGLRLGRNTSEGQIIDSTVVVSFNQSSYRVMEDDGTVNIMIVLSRISSVPLQIIMSITNFTVIAAENYNGSHIAVNVPAGVAMQPLTINIIDNNIVECDDILFNVTMMSVTTCGAVIGSDRNSEVMIRDDDGAIVSLNKSQYSVTENDSPLTGAITLSSRASEDVIVEVTISDGSANAGIDYAMSTALVFNFTVSAGSTSSSFIIDIINDMIQEDNETFNIAIRLLPSCLSLSLGTSSSTVMIIDDDVALITFTSSTFSGLESSGVISATIAISGGIVSSKNINIPITFIEGNASATDFDSLLQTITIVTGTNNSTVNILVYNDTVVEGDETFDISLTVPSLLGPGITSGSIIKATVTIIDTTRIMVNFVSKQYTGSELEGFVLVTLELLNGTSAYPFNVAVIPSEQSPVSAQGGIDFSNAMLNVTFASGMTMSSVSLVLINDSVAEGREEFNLNLNVSPSLAPAITAGVIDFSTGIIIDSNELIVGFASGQFIGSESSGFIVVIVRITGGSSIAPITVTVTPSVQSPVSAMGSGVDFNSSPFNITINAGATDGRANVSVTCDDEVEGLETFDMTLTITSDSPVVRLDRDRCEGQIIDNTVLISFNQSSYRVMEDDGSVTLLILLSQASSVPFEVEINSIDLMAKDTEDYDGSNLIITIPTGIEMQAFAINIIDNNIVECNEKFNVTMTSVTTCGVTIGSDRISEVMIRDDDGATVSLSQSHYSVVESDSPLTGTVTLSSRTSEDVIVEVTISDGSANAGVDYAMSTALVFNVTISAGSTSSLFSIDIINDMIQEDNETFNIAIRLLPSCLSLSLGNSSSTVMIIDNEELTVEFSSSIFDGIESTGIVSVTLLLRGGVSASDITVTVFPYDQSPVSAEGNGVDYTSDPITAVFIAGTSSTSIDVPVNVDGIAEAEPETFNLNFTISPSMKAIFQGKINMAFGRINDIENITLSFNQTAYIINESSGHVRVTLSLSIPSSTIITISFIDISNTAIRDTDYLSGPYNVTFPVGNTTASFDVTIDNDKILEHNESFTLMIVADTLPAKVISSAQTIVVIVDDDSATIRFNQSQYSIIEGNTPLRPSLILSNPSSYDITIQVISVDGTAIGDDYSSEPYNVKFLPEITSVPFDVSITNDNILEGNETFSLIIGSSLVPDKIIIDSPNVSTVTIVDNDTLMVQFSSSRYTGSESTGNISITLLLEGGTSSSDITVIVETSNQSAEGGKDYTSDPVNATFLPGSSRTTINIPITKDNITEEIETFNLGIALPSTADTRISIGGQTTAIGRIIDESTLVVEFESDEFVGDESSQSVQIAITKSNALSSTVIAVRITFSEHPSMPATGSGVDYDSSAIDVDIAPNDIISRVTIPVVCDRLIEGTEKFNISLSLISVSQDLSVELGLKESVGVIEDSTVNARFEHSTYSIKEDSVSLNLMIILSKPSLETLELPIDWIDINTTGTADFSQQRMLVMVSPGTVMHQFTINITNDSIIECDETFSLSISTMGTWCGLNNDNGTTEVTIIDDDFGELNISQPPLLVLESIGSFVINLSLNATASEIITILATMANVNASIGSDFSFTALSSQLTSRINILSGSLSASISISIRDDTVQEYNETFVVSLQLLPHRCFPINLIGENSFAITIIDNEELTVEFNQATYKRRERSQYILVTLDLLGGTAMYDFNVTIFTSPISAIAGVDFDNATINTTFIAGTTVATISIPIADDTVVDEEDEEFSLTFELIPTTGVRVSPGSRSKATGIILDTTPPQMYIHPMDKTISINNDSTSTSFTCIANGSRSYFWERDDGDIAINAEGIRNTHLELFKLLPSHSGGYRCAAMNLHGTTYSKYAVLTVEALPPVVRIAPFGELRRTEGTSVQFRCMATGVGFRDFEYQWFLNEERIADQGSQTLFVSSISEGNTGDYTCFVSNPYGGIGQSSNKATLVLEQYCDPVIVSYDGFNITWNETLVGITVVAPCTGPGLSGNVSRRCIMDDQWDQTVNCFRKKTGELRDKAANLTMSLSELNDTEAIAQAGNIADSLANVTLAAEEPIFAADIDLAVGILTTLNNVTETVGSNLTADDLVFEGTANVLNNLLSEANQENWQQLEDNSPATSQMLVTSAEQATRILSKTLDNNTPKAIKARPNIILKAERVSNESLSTGYIFPDESDNLSAYTGGSAQVMVPGGLLQNLSANSSSGLTISSTVIRDGTGFRLPSSNNGSAAPQVPASPIFSLQIDPNPDPMTLQNSPIMMMFDVSIPDDDLSEEEAFQDQPNSGIQNQQNFDAQNQNFKTEDVTCNFYDHTLITDDLNQVGGWSTEGVSVDRNNSNKTSVSCLTTHLTSFAVLVSIQDERPRTPADEALSIISYIGCSISLFCLCVSIVFLSYVIYKTKDTKNNLFIHLNLCIALALGLIVFIAGIEHAANNKVACKFVAALLQYLFTSAFCWMLCEGVILYMMLVTVFGNKLNSRRFFLLLGWGPAIPIVAISVGVAHEHYGTKDYCWIKSDDGAIAAFIVPIVAMMLINCVFLAITLKVLWDNKRKTMSEKESANADVAKDLLKAIIVLLPLLGLTWIIGIFAVNNETQVFAWIFAILNSFQGVFIFIFHVLRNKQVVKEMKDRYRYFSGTSVFRMFTSRGSGNTGTLGLSTKPRTSQSSSSEVGGRGKKMSTTSFGSGGGGGDYFSLTLERRTSKDEYLSTTLERRLSKDKAEALEDSIFEDEKQIKMTTFRKVEESIVEEQDIGMEEKQSVKDNRDVDEEDKKSITEENIEEGKKSVTQEADEEQKKSSAEDVVKEKKSSTEEGGPVTIERIEAAVTTKPTPLPRTIK